VEVATIGVVVVKPLGWERTTAASATAIIANTKTVARVLEVFKGQEPDEPRVL